MELALASCSAEYRRSGPQGRVDSPEDSDAGGAVAVRRMSDGDSERSEVRRHRLTPS